MAGEYNNLGTGNNAVAGGYGNTIGTGNNYVEGYWNDVGTGGNKIGDYYYDPYYGSWAKAQGIFDHDTVHVHFIT